MEKENFNVYLKNVNNSIWTFSPSVEFISQTAYEVLLKDKSKNDKYGYLHFIASYDVFNAPASNYIIGFPKKKYFLVTQLYAHLTNNIIKPISFFCLIQFQND